MCTVNDKDREIGSELSAEIQTLQPPSVRDREIYERVMVHQQTQQAVAGEYSLTQARVSQIVAEVSDWLANATGKEAGDLSPAQALRLGSRVVRMRLEHLLGVFMQSWRSSQGEIASQRERDGENGSFTEKITRTSFGDCKYLTQYLRVALCVARLDGVVTSPKVKSAESLVIEVKSNPLPAAARIDEKPAVVEVSAKQANSGDLYSKTTTVQAAVASSVEPDSAKLSTNTSYGEVDRRKWSSRDRNTRQKTAYKDRRKEFLNGGVVSPLQG